MKTALAIVVVLAAACSKKESEAPAKAAPGSAEAPREKRHLEHEPMAPELSKFHDLLAPRWHAAKGEPRTKDTCSAVPEFAADADAIGKATPPAGADAAKWASGAKALADAVAALDAACKGGDAAAFEPAFARVHEGFHAMLEVGAGVAHEPAGNAP